MITLKHCTLLWTPTGALTRFADGAETEACWHDTAHYHVIAHRLGYGDDLLGYAREHEFAHSFVAEKLFDRPSEVLWHVAHETMLSGKQAAYEEFFAQGFQRYLRTNERPILSGLPRLGMWRDEALALLVEVGN